MSEHGEDLFYDCVICSGAKTRERNGPNGTRCKHNSCKDELTRRNTEMRAALQSPAGDSAVVDQDPVDR